MSVLSTRVVHMSCMCHTHPNRAEAVCNLFLAHPLVSLVLSNMYSASLVKPTRVQERWCTEYPGARPVMEMRTRVYPRHAAVNNLRWVVISFPAAPPFRPGMRRIYRADTCAVTMRPDIRLRACLWRSVPSRR